MAEDTKPANVCPNCFEKVEEGATQCSLCGFDLTGDAAVGAGDRAPGEAES